MGVATCTRKIMNLYKRVLFIGIFALVGCSRKADGDLKAQDPIPKWTVIEYQKTELAYKASKVEVAIEVLESLVAQLESRAKNTPPEYRIESGIWVNKMRLAGALYAKGDRTRALSLVDAIVQLRAGHQVNTHELASGRAEIFGWLINEYTVRKPIWGSNAVSDFNKALVEEQKANGGGM